MTVYELVIVVVFSAGLNKEIWSNIQWSLCIFHLFALFRSLVFAAGWKMEWVLYRWLVGYTFWALLVVYIWDLLVDVVEGMRGWGLYRRFKVKMKINEKCLLEI